MSLNIGDLKSGTVVVNDKHKTEEIIDGIGKIKVNGEWVSGVFYHGIDRFTGEPCLFARETNDFTKDFTLKTE